MQLSILVRDGGSFREALILKIILYIAVGVGEGFGIFKTLITRPLHFTELQELLYKPYGQKWYQPFSVT